MKKGTLLAARCFVLQVEDIAGNLCHSDTVSREYRVALEFEGLMLASSRSRLEKDYAIRGGLVNIKTSLCFQLTAMARVTAKLVHARIMFTERSFFTQDYVVRSVNGGFLYYINDILSRYCDPATVLLSNRNEPVSG